MRKMLLIFLVTLSFKAISQDFPFPPHPDKKLRIEMVASDAVINRFTIGATYRYKDRFSAGMNMSSLFGNKDMDNDIFDRNKNIIHGFYTGIYHQVYLSRSINDNCAFFRTTASFQQMFIPYETEDWVSYIEDGITYYRIEDVTKEYNIQTLGLCLELGLEMYRDLFFFDITVGILMRQKLSGEERPESFSDTYNFMSSDYSGVSPMMGLRFGFYLN